MLEIKIEPMATPTFPSFSDGARVVENVYRAQLWSQKQNTWREFSANYVANYDYMVVIYKESQPAAAAFLVEHEGGVLESRFEGVIKPMRGQGLGRILFEAIQRFAVAQGFNTFLCFVDLKKDHPLSRRSQGTFVRHLGFTRSDEFSCLEGDVAYCKAIGR